MKILIELPTWLGDCIMAIPAIESLMSEYPDAEVTVVGSFVSTELFRTHPRVVRIVIDTTKKEGNRFLNIYRLARELGPHDLALSFRSHIFSNLLLWFSGSKRRRVYSKKGLKGHQVEKYQQFVNRSVGTRAAAGEIILPYPASPYARPTLGINPGAAYGSAKRWYPEKFAEVAAALSGEYDIVIFGGPCETDIAADIEAELHHRNVDNVINLAGRTSIRELCEKIGGLKLFVTGDSGPMHIAAAYRVPTVSLFGPTRHDETSQWHNPRSVIIRHELPCSPCMKRECPLKHHECMKSITAQEVIEAVRSRLN
jgi:heptosyltransferase-2